LMARTRSVDFLPEIFRTDANRQFLAATLDTLTQEPNFRKSQGYIGRTVGPGVNPNDSYIIEPDKTRADYQLEAGVVSLKPDTDEILDVITYPGLNDAIQFQGGDGGRPDRLYESDYYAWDPFIDFDTFVNFSQYYWLPSGPDSVTVQAAGTQATGSFQVTRGQTGYTFSGQDGVNPTLELVRGGSYAFQVAQNRAETVNLRVRNQSNAAYVIDNINNPELTLIRGNTYVFSLSLRGDYPFWIKTQPTLGEANAYNDGVSRNGSVTGNVTFTVPRDAPDTLYYISQTQLSMQGVLRVVDGTPGTGPGFWIQTNPGITGRLPFTPNISSRDVFGVVNNGDDLGVITFNVPSKTAQAFYYNLPVFSQPVDLITSLRFDEINNQRYDDFLAQYGGIDGTTNLNNRTLVFDNVQEGWNRTTFFDPLQPGSANNFVVGSYDTTLFDQTTEIPVADRNQLWQITLNTLDGVQYIELARIAAIPEGTKFTLRYGTEFSSTSWYKTSLGAFEPIPLLTALNDTLYYQDSANPAFVGTIKLIDEAQSTTLFVNDILGQTQYTAPNGVAFTNGLKVVFRGDVIPSEYGSGTLELECTATTSGFNTITTDSTERLYVGQEIVFAPPTLGGLDPGTSYFVQAIVNSFQFTVATIRGGGAVALQTGTGSMTATAINFREFYVSGVGTSIELLPVENFVTPETYVRDGDDSTLAKEPGDQDYITVDRASQDRNAWSRSNRWFHLDVIQATADYNDTVAVLDNTARAKRPIIQFRPDIRLFNMGTQGKDPVDIIDFSATDAFSNIEGSTGYTVDGYQFVNGTRVIFANDDDPDVANKIWVVEFVVPDTVPPLIAQPIINLRLAPDGVVLLDQSTVCLDGTVNQGKTFWFDGTDWIESQQKTSVQQAPLYDVYDSTGVSFSDQVKYPSSDFVGSRLFSYAVGDTSRLDPVLALPLQYLNIENIGDIVFDNNLYTDSFVYTRDNVSVTQDISSGTPREYTSRTEFDRLLGWQQAVTTTKVYQQFKFVYQGPTLELDVRANDPDSIPVIKLYAGSVFQDPATYSYTRTDVTTTITLTRVYDPDTVIEVLVLSDQTSRVAFYQVPINFENNPLNTNSGSFTLGTIRQHYQSICENLPGITGAISGANNSRDLGNLVPYGLTILQQSAPLTLAGYFMRANEYNIFDALVYNSREYIKYKNLVLDSVTQQVIAFETPAQILDAAIESITLGRVETQPFYWSDMVPSGAVYIENNYTVSFITTTTFDTVQVYDFESQNYLGLNVYLNDEILTRGFDYVVATDGPRLTIITPLAVGDQVTIREYQTTYGNYCPNTPTKLGLYPAFRPEIITVQTSDSTQQVIVGHDGSYTKLFGDIRDSVLLELETRIYNNIKLDGNPTPLTQYDVLPGQFRDTGFTFQEINTILSQDFLSYVAWNKLDYRTQDYQANNPFTWNYSAATNRLNGNNLLGAWRGIYRYFYDTETPEQTPWEMLGLSIKPDWWDITYGDAPYTRDNLVLWDDLEAGLVRDPIAPYVVSDFVRPRLSEVIPTGSQGELLSPLDSVVATYAIQQTRRSWSLGDGGPTEASWYNSSAYPFAVMRLLAVTRPAKFFALFADRDLYRFNTEFGQYLYNDRFRLDANGVEVYGNGISKASFIDWIVDYNRQTGMDSTQDLTDALANLDVRMCYRMAAFSDKKYIRVFTEKASPESENTSFQIPDESYDLLLYKNQPFSRATYSSVLIQQTAGGYAVFGYSTFQPYFNILQSQAAGRLQTITVAGATVRVPTLYTSRVTQVPYGFIFADRTAVCDFLLSYGEFLRSQGFVFTNIDNGIELTWNQMVNEFLYWSQQGWDENAIIALNPLAAKLSVTRPRAVVDTIAYQTADNVILDQNRRELPTKNINIVRIDNTLSLQPLNNQTLSFVDLRYTTYEHMIVLDNRSVFGDLIYDPTTGARQGRLNLVAFATGDWNGSINAPGFILNQDNVQEWTGARIYSKGEIVRYKGTFWSAQRIVQPSVDFNYNDWVQSDYEQIQQGLLPNLANKADQLANSYNINSANLEQDNDLLSYGLIGFRPRQYMANLDLDDVSQVNIYRQFLDTKGTLQSAELFNQANLDKEGADYQIYENWAVQRAVYGANANRSFFELRLNRALLDANPSLIQVITPDQASIADQTVLLSSIWRQSYKLTSPNILPVTYDVPTDTALPSAGYVNLDDVDITVFDLDEAGSLEANIERINTDTSIWVARVNDYDWNIYRAQPVPGNISHVCDNLDQTSLVIFTQQHGLTVGDKIIIRFFDTEVDGVYDVISVPSLTKITIAFTFTGSRTVVNGTGLAFTLGTMRVAQFSDAIDLPYTNTLNTGARLWVDDLGQGQWAALEKQEVFSFLTQIAPAVPDTVQGFGASVAQGADRFVAMVGSPQYAIGTDPKYGAVYVYVKNDSNLYQPVSPISSGDAVITLTTPGVRSLGTSLSIGNKDWAVSGAPGSLNSLGQADGGYAVVIYRDTAAYLPDTNPYRAWQMLTSPGNLSGQGQLGSSVAVSQDERWMYVGEPGVNKVHAYGRVPWQDQIVIATADGFQTEFGFADDIQVDHDQQLEVFVNGTLQTLTVDYTILAFSTVIFASAPATGAEVTLRRRRSLLLDSEVYFSVTGTAVLGGSGALFTVTRVRNTLTVDVQASGSGYSNGDTITIPASSVWSPASSPVSPTNDVTFTINVSGGAIESINTPQYVAPALLDTFQLGDYFFTVGSINSFSVFVDDELQRPNLDYDWNQDDSSVGQDITFLPGSIPAVGARIVVQAQGYWQYVDTLTVPGINSDARFGDSVSCTTDGRQVLIGAPNATVNGEIQAGAAYVFDRNVQRFVYGLDPSSTTFTVLGTVTAPVSVSVDSQFLINETDAVVNAPNSFAVSGNNITLNTDLVVGAEVEIETNQFALVQTLSQPTAAEFSNFGQSTDICRTNCSLVIGAPQSSVQIYKGGVVERLVNQARAYGIILSDTYTGTLTPGDTLRVNDIDVAVPAAPNNNLAGLAAAIDAAVPNVSALVTNNQLQISVANTEAADPYNQVQVLPGSVGTVFATLGFDLYYATQTITSPLPREFAQFGAGISLSGTGSELAIGVPQGNMYITILFDDDATEFDAGATEFFSEIVQSGTVYVYDLASSVNASITNPARYIIGQQLVQPDLLYLDQFGRSVNYRGGVLWAAAPGSDISDSSSADYGQIFVWENATGASAWSVKYRELPSVDIRLLNSVFLYDSVSSSTTQFLDFFNPLQGKVLGAVQQNLDYVGAVDPAGYNSGSGLLKNTWGQQQVGSIWWDTSTVRFVDPNQDSIIYAARQWGQLFPGSSVDVYQWIVSDVPPASYVGTGTPLNSRDYVVNTVLTQEGFFQTQYFYWVRGVTSVATARGKTLSVDALSRYIEDPRSTGIAYLAPINASTVAIYNCETLIEAQDTVLHVEFDREFTTDNVHVEYELVPQDRADGWITDNLYRKLQDSLCGVDTAGNLVPDIFLSPPERYGVQFRPRQSMFVDRFEALRNYVIQANSVLARYPISETRSFNLLNSVDPEPSLASGEWDLRVATVEILGFQDIYDVPLGYRYLVQSDTTQQGRWTIYTVALPQPNSALRELVLTKVQNFVTPDYWSYIDWYRPGYNTSIRAVLEVPNTSALSTLTTQQVPVGSSVRVTANSQGKFEIYLRTDTGFERVGLQDGTIALSAELYDYALGRFGFDVEVFDAQYFDQEPVIETRRIIQALNQELFVDDLLIERNRLLVLVFNFVLSEFSAPEWLSKTSLIDVTHRIRELLPFQNYRPDNQEFVLDYLQEVKPYHVQVKEFSLNYFGNDAYPGDVNDFDLPAYFNTDLSVPRFTSPILLPYEAGTAQVSNNLSNLPADSIIWQTWPWNQWYNNYLMTLESVSVTNPGSGYTEAPQVVITGDATVPAQARAIIDSSGGVIEIVLLSSGSGYRAAPTITLTGGNGTGAAAYPRLTNDVIRQFRATLRYDRYQYQTQIETWSPNGTYVNGTLVRYQNSVWRADSSDGSSAVVGPDFNLEDWVPVAASELSGVDRVMGFYVAGVNSPGLDLPLLVDGVSYPGVQVWGDYFTGIESLNATYRSSFTDLFLGTRPTDINVDGGEFIGPFEGHAPEELVNGSEFDTLDLRVYTRPGSDWQANGHGFETRSTVFEYNQILADSISYQGLVEDPVQVLLFNQTTGRFLDLGLDYTVDWVTQEITILPTLNTDDGDLINVTVYETGGGSQLYRDSYAGSAIASGVFFIPVNAAEIQSIAIFIDGTAQSALPTWVPYIDSVAWDILETYAFNTVVNNSGNYYRSLQAVPLGTAITDTEYWLGFVPTLETQVTMGVPPAAGTEVAIVVLGIPNIDPLDLTVGRSYTITTSGTTNWAAVGSPSGAVGTTFVATGQAGGSGIASTIYSWSTPQVQTVTANATVVANFGFELDSNIGGTNTANMIVMRNGVRLTPPAGIEWTGDGTTNSFGLPQRFPSAFLQSSINSATDITVWLDGVLQVQSVGSIVGNYSVTNFDGSNTPGRQIVFNVNPPDGAQILISVSTLADYDIAGQDIQFKTQPTFGDVYSILTWNDTSQQNLATLVFYGPVLTGISITEPYDSTPFDSGTVNFGPGSFDYELGTSIPQNDFFLNRDDVEAGRLWVTLDGVRLFEGQDYIVENGYLVLASGAIGSSQILAVTMYTNSIVPQAAAFRIFQDMRGIQATYRITASTTTELAQPLSITSDIIYLQDASRLTVPNLEDGVFGVITIDAERITYRNIDLAANTVSGLRRGTAGTAIAAHAAGALVYDLGRGNLLPAAWQNYTVSDTAPGDGSTTVFYAPSIDITDFGDSSSIYVDSIEVYVGGERQLRYGQAGNSQYRWIVTDFEPCAVEFVADIGALDPDVAPPAGVEVTVLQRRGRWWYELETAADRRLALQETDNIPARFLTDR